MKLKQMSQNILDTADKYKVAYIYDNNTEYRIVSDKGKYILSDTEVNITFDLLSSMRHAKTDSIINFINNI